MPKDVLVPGAGMVAKPLVDYLLAQPELRVAMASRTAAIAARLIVEERIALAGVRIPVLPEIYEPVPAELERFGTACVERRRPLEESKVPLFNAGCGRVLRVAEKSRPRSEAGLISPSETH